MCDARVDCFYTLNMDFELALDPAAASWTEVFPDAAALDARGMGPGWGSINFCWKEESYDVCETSLSSLCFHIGF